MRVPPGGGAEYATAETRIKEQFAQIVGEVSLQDLAVLNTRDGMDPGDRIPLDQYGLTPITPPAMWYRYSWLPAAYSGDLVPDISVQYYESIGAEGDFTLRDSPFLDSGFGIGLTYELNGTRTLVAVSSAGIYPSLGIPQEGPDAPTYAIKQFQGLVREDLQPELAESLGGRSGFFWRNTLARIHEHVARRLGMRRVALVCDYTENTEEHRRIRAAVHRLAREEGYVPVKGSILETLIYEKYLD
jgi:hypothetical protein